MKGSKCVAIASDLRVGEQYHTLSGSQSKIFVLSPHIAVAPIGFLPDVQKLIGELKQELKRYEFNEHRRMRPQTFFNFLGTHLYSYRKKGGLLIEVVGVAYDAETEDTIVFASDSLGCSSYFEKGTSTGGGFRATTSLMESLW